MTVSPFSVCTQSSVQKPNKTGIQSNILLAPSISSPLSRLEVPHLPVAVSYAHISGPHSPSSPFTIFSMKNRKRQRKKKQKKTLTSSALHRLSLVQSRSLALVARLAQVLEPPHLLLPTLCGVVCVFARVCACACVCACRGGRVFS